MDIQAAIVGGVKGEWLGPAQSTPGADKGAAILYLHGGAYCLGSPATHRALTSHLARITGLPVFVADYRLAPEHPFPAAVDDAVAAYRSLSKVGPVVVAGDSAGGGLALAAALAIRQTQIAPPAALVLFSPWIDLTTAPRWDDAATCEAMLSDAWLDDCARHYLAGGDPTAPLASPIYGELRGLPPILIQSGSDEILLGDTVRLDDALQDAGVTVRCEIVPARWHAFQLHAGMLPAADAAIARAGSFISLHIAS